jgi:hypothetical protein
MRLKLSILIILVLGLIFLPTAIIVVFGMIPTIVVFSTDRSVGRSKTICVGAMNFAGCFPFLLEFHTQFGQQTVDNAFRLVGDFETLIVIYVLAAGGYAIDRAVTGIASSLIVQRSESRLKKLEKEKKKLISKWGEKVSGKYKLDDYGFPIDPIPESSEQNQEEPTDKNTQ